MCKVKSGNYCIGPFFLPLIYSFIYSHYILNTASPHYPITPVTPLQISLSNSPLSISEKSIASALGHLITAVLSTFSTTEAQLGSPVRGSSGRQQSQRQLMLQFVRILKDKKKLKICAKASRIILWHWSLRILVYSEGKKHFCKGKVWTSSWLYVSPSNPQIWNRRNIIYSQDDIVYRHCKYTLNLHRIYDYHSSQSVYIR